MMNIKDTLNFTKLREKGPSALDLKNDEVIQLVTRDSEIKVIITQEYFLTLLSVYNNMLIENGHKKEERNINIKEKISEFEEELRELVRLTQEDKEKEECKTGHQKVGNF